MNIPHAQPAPDPLRESFRRRATAAVERMAREATPETLADALAAPSDLGAVVRVASDEAAAEASRRQEPFAAAIARMAGVKADLAERAGGLLPAASVASMLGITRAAVDKRRAAGRLLAVKVRGDWRYPAAQFAGGEAVPGLDEVIARKPNGTGWTILDFLLAPHGPLGGATPIEALRAGRLAEIRRLLDTEAADAFG